MHALKSARKPLILFREHCASFGFDFAQRIPVVRGSVLDCSILFTFSHPACCLIPML